jgi:hypothetical protein
MLEYMEFAEKLRGIARRADMFGHDRARVLEEIIFAAENYEKVAEHMIEQAYQTYQDGIGEGQVMYLTGKRYLRSWEKGDSETAKSISKMFPELGDNQEITVTQIEAEFMYWRKANAIHQWFVDHVQKGDDNCGEYLVSEEDFIALRDACRLVLNDPENAEKYLPTQGGFFFGGTDYDEGYFDDVRRTLDWLDTILFVNKFDPKLQQWDFYYQSSW